MRVLIVKTSSLGDIVHALPALTEARRARPELVCDWLAERAFAQIPAWHPAVRRVIGCDLRAWRRHPWQTWTGGEWKAFRAAVRAEPYDLVIDAQGLVKSAWLAGRAKGPLAGPDFHSAREPMAAALYGRRYRVPRHDAAHAIDRVRSLFAQALGYALAAEAAPAGLDRARFPRPAPDAPYALLLHGTTWPGKRWPLASWQALARDLAARGIEVVLPWGSAAEQADANAIAAACGGRVLPRLDLTGIAGWLAHARLAVGVDTGLAHLAAAFGTPQITLYGPTLPALTGARGENQVWLRSGEATTIDRARPTTVGVDRVRAAIDTMLDPAAVSAPGAPPSPAAGCGAAPRSGA